jgi:hypothetical protein
VGVDSVGVGWLLGLPSTLVGDGAGPLGTTPQEMNNPDIASRKMIFFTGKITYLNRMSTICLGFHYFAKTF